MTIKPVKVLLSSLDPRSAVYAGLAPEALTPAPFPKCEAQGPVGHLSVRRFNKLTAKQARTFLGEAVKRVRAEAESRAGKYLRRLDTVHEGGSRSRAERWQALHMAIEPLLARLDIATGVLGYLDKNGQFHVSRQTGLANDAALNPARTCRLLKALQKAGYAVRKLKRMYKQGKQWVTRVTVYLKPCFFYDLGLGMLHAQARTAKAKTYLKKKRLAKQREDEQHLKDLADAQARRMSHRQAEGKREASRQAAANMDRIERMRARAGILLQLKEQNPHLSDADITAMYRRLHPD